MIRCNACNALLTPDTPYRVWIDTGRCRACLIGRSESRNECSWCLDLYGIEPKDGESHGICARHVAEMDVRIEALRASRRATVEG